MKLRIVAMLCSIILLAASDPECEHGVPAPSMKNCHRAVDLMMKDFKKYPYIRYVARTVRREGDYVLPKHFPFGEGTDRCVITIDVYPPSESDITSLDYLGAMALRIISFCVNPAWGIPGIGQDWLPPKNVILVKVSTTMEDGRLIVPVNAGEARTSSISSVAVL